jgi:hypothetical protein
MGHFWEKDGEDEGEGWGELAPPSNPSGDIDMSRQFLSRIGSSPHKISQRAVSVEGRFCFKRCAIKKAISIACS